VYSRGRTSVYTVTPRAARSPAMATAREWRSTVAATEKTWSSSGARGASGEVIGPLL